MSTDQNKTIVRKYFDMWNTGNVGMADEILSPNYVDIGHPEIKSTDDVKNSVIKIRKAFPDFQITINTQICEENTVASIGTVSRSHEGKKITSEIMWFIRIENERMSELKTGAVTLA